MGDMFVDKGIDMAFLILKRVKGFRLVHRTTKGKKVTDRFIPSEELGQYGFSPTMSTEEALRALQLLRRDEKVKKSAEHQSTILGKLHKSEWLPPDWLREFEATILPELNVRPDRWNKAKDVIEKLPIAPEDWHWRPSAIYAVLVSMGAGLSYTRKLLALINKWGAFYCRKRRTAFLPIERPRQETKSRLLAASYRLHGDRSTRPLLPEHLMELRLHLPEAQWRGLYIMFWAALRPEEARTPKFKLQLDDPRGFPVLHALQPKLERRGIHPRLCWKAVPFVEPEQLEMLSWLKENAFAFPSVKRLRVLGITARSARLGFVAVMQARGYSERCYQRWLGHIGRSTVQQYYESKAIAYYESPTKKAG